MVFVVPYFRSAVRSYFRRRVFRYKYIIGVLRIELRPHAPEACILPLYYTPFFSVSTSILCNCSRARTQLSAPPQPNQTIFYSSPQFEMRPRTTGSGTSHPSLTRQLALLARYFPFPPPPFSLRQRQQSACSQHAPVHVQNQEAKAVQAQTTQSRLVR